MKSLDDFGKGFMGIFLSQIIKNLQKEINKKIKVICLSIYINDSSDGVQLDIKSKFEDGKIEIEDIKVISISNK